MLRACHGILIGCTPVYAVNYNTAGGTDTIKVKVSCVYIVHEYMHHAM